MPIKIADFTPYIGLFAGVLLLSLVATGVCVKIAKRIGLVATPDERTAHRGAKPLGGGGPVVGLALAAWAFCTGLFPPIYMALLVGAAGLAVISLIDDFKVVSAPLRFSLQSVAVAACLYFLPFEQHVIWDGWSIYIDRAVTALLWLWFINLYNFMDGIDGLAATETIAICVGIVLVGSIVGLAMDHILLAAFLACSAAGFLPWNWHKSKIMLGDLGAIPIGFMLGFLLINLAMNGHIIAALILPLYFVADASFTLVGRILRGELFWRPHNQHFYQKAVRLGGIGHDQVVLRIVGANIVFIGAAVLSVSNALLAIVVAGVGLFAILVHLYLVARRGQVAANSD